MADANTEILKSIEKLEKESLQETRDHHAEMEQQGFRLGKLQDIAQKVNDLQEEVEKREVKKEKKEDKRSDLEIKTDKLKEQKKEKKQKKDDEKTVQEMEAFNRLADLGWEDVEIMEEVAAKIASGLTFSDQQLQEMKSNKEAIHLQTKKDEQRAEDDKNKQEAQLVSNMKQEEWLKDLLTIGEWNKDFAERAAKKAMQMKQGVEDWFKDKKKQLASAGMGLLEMLMKGAGLYVLYKIFDWLSKQDLKDLYNTMVEAWDKFSGGIAALRVWWMMIGERLKKTKFGRMITKGLRAIRTFFGGSGAIWKIMVALINFFGPKSTMGKFSTRILEFILRMKARIKSFFKPFINLMKTLGGLGKFAGLDKIMKFLKGIMKVFGKLFLPISLLMGAWAAISGGLDEAAEESGGFPQKIMSFISGALKGLLDFFIFDLANLIQDGIKWAIGWFMGLFGFNEEEIEKATDFDFVKPIKDAVFGAIDWIRGLFRFDGKGIKFDGLAPLMDILMWPLNEAIDWVRELLGFKKEGDEDFSIGKLVTGVLNDIFAWFKSLLDIDFTAMLKKIPGAGMVMDLLKGKEDSKSKEELSKMGLIDHDTFGKDDLELEKIKKEIAERRKKGENISGLISALTNVAKDESIDEGDRKKLAKILKAEGATLATGGYFSGGMALVGENGPEIMVSARPANVIPAPETRDLMAGMGGGPSIAPTTIVNSSSSPVTTYANSSSHNPYSDKYFRN